MKAFVGGLLIATALSAPARAAEEPKSVKQDQHVQVVAYDPDNPVYLHLHAGFVTDIRVSDKEKITDIYGSSDSLVFKHFSAHDAVIKPKMSLPPQPMFIKTARLDGSGDRMYPLVLDAVDPDPPPGLPGTGGAIARASLIDVSPAPDDGRPYIVRYTYPADEAAAAAAKRGAAVAAWQAKRHTQQINAKMRQPDPVVINSTYRAQGTAAEVAALMPDATWDDGQSTFFRFDGNRRLPVPYVLNPDGNEAVVDYSVVGRTLTIHQTAKAFRLRDGDQILCVFNGNYTPGGHDNGTGTTRPDVVREMGAKK